MPSKSRDYLKYEGWVEGGSGKKIKKISEKPICVCNLTGTIHLITGTINGRPLAGAISFRCASFCSNYGKVGIFKQGIYRNKDHGELIGWVLEE